MYRGSQPSTARSLAAATSQTPHRKSKSHPPFPFPSAMARATAAASSLVAASALLVLLLALAARSAAAGGAGEVPLSWELGVGGEEPEDGFGFSAGGDAVSRRVLQNMGYISYGALRRDNVPCSVRGASYYNCRTGGQANPYSRGCSAIARCRG